MPKTKTTNSNVYPEGETLTVEKIKAVMAEMERHRLPHSVYNIGNATFFRGWLQRNKIIERKTPTVRQVTGRDPMFSSLSGIEVIETPALKFNQMAYVENGVIRGVFELTI